MQDLLKFLTYFSAFQSLLPFLKPSDRSKKTLLWLPKMIAGALSPIVILICGFGVLVGLLRRNWKMTSAGLIGAGFSAKFMIDIPDSEGQFVSTYGKDWNQKIPDWLEVKISQNRFSLLSQPRGEVQFKQNIVLGKKPAKDVNFVADLWLPMPASPSSGLGLIYAHGSGWRMGDKDMGTRHCFSRLASQGHVVLDIAYSLWPEADLITMVKEVNQAILWMKENASNYGIHPDKIVLMGGSAGAHLALLAAYAPKEKSFQAFGENDDTSVCGVVAFYPPVDLHPLQAPFEEYNEQATPKLLEKIADKMIQGIFQLDTPSKEVRKNKSTRHDMIAEMLGGTQEEIPETYALLSPITHVGPQCPPTLLIQGRDDVFELAQGVREMHAKLVRAGVSAIWIEFPHTEHGFDLLFPQISPVAQAAIYDLERFLAMLMSSTSTSAANY
jgi:acetyl esterase/lipase